MGAQLASSTPSPQPSHDAAGVSRLVVVVVMVMQYVAVQPIFDLFCLLQVGAWIDLAGFQFPER